jgi:hypothetical protein
MDWTYRWQNHALNKGLGQASKQNYWFERGAPLKGLSLEMAFDDMMTLFFLGMFSCWVNDSCIWANSFLPAGPRVGCQARLEPGAAVQQPCALIT